MMGQFLSRAASRAATAVEDEVTFCARQHRIHISYMHIKVYLQ